MKRLILQVPSSSRSNAAGVTWAALGVGLFALIYVSGKLSGGSASALQIMWLRYAGGFATVGALWLFVGTPFERLRTDQAHVHALRAAAGGFGGVAAVYAAENMPVSSASAIGLLDGFFVVLFGIAFLRERLGRWQWAAACLCLAGAAVVVAGRGALDVWDMQFWWPALVALGGAMLVAIESILIKMLARTESALTVLFYVNTFGTLILAGPGLWQWHPISPLLFAAFLCLGPIAILAQACNIMAFRHADAAVIGPVRYCWVVYGVLFGVVFFGEMPTGVTVLGALMVLAGGIWLAAARGRAPRP